MRFPVRLHHAAADAEDREDEPFGEAGDRAVLVGDRIELVPK